MDNKRIILMAGDWDTTPVVYNFLKKNFPISKAVVEEPVPKKIFLRKRISKLGILTVAGQILFQLLIAKPLKLRSVKRIRQILENYHLSTEPMPSTTVLRVSSVNSEECLKHLQLLKPDLVIVHGTRIIAKKILQSVGCPFINIHAGITPRYRGSHGAYWALANNDAENCGVTVHFIDAGIDTGDIIYQEQIPLTEYDNFSTYSYLQLAVGLNLLKKAIHSFFEDKIEIKKSELNSALWHHPTLWGYFYKRLVKRIK